ncbi:helix-turn-helix domain-containing protein [Chryseobacterium sp. KMC2]|uniref:helix-turn-helix domain-containing protein n=1 Tax=Chryseobacterium sp. KMC2 TaxID=2800705 RepID=UPI0019226A85|nr:helix-turn-helix transcriptional regulator [Chryseobacterium sp. KMC2]MBL3548856.1 helix-turn-helix transcriptional regulator [Chryseobacterium sp. KMC2]
MAELFKYIYTSLPMISSLTCGMLFVVAYGQELTKVEKQVKKLLGVYFAFMVLSWVYVQFNFNYEHLLKYYLPLVCFVLQLNQVIFYHFISLLTPVEKDNLFHIKVHYIIPLILLFVSGIFMITFTGINQLSNDAVSSLFMPYTSLSVFFFMLCYAILGSIRVIRYKRILIKKHGREKWKVMRWMVPLMVVRFLLLILFICNPLQLNFVLIAMTLLVPVQHIIIVYNILMRNYAILSFGDHNTVMIAGGEIIALSDVFNNQEAKPVSNASLLLAKEELEQYYEESKPYLNAGFKMQDLAVYFETNRTYLSGFINKTFGVNFSQYNNLWRLKEMKYLLEHPEHKDKNQEELALMAGFSTPRAYWRAKKAAEQKVEQKDNE